MPRRVAARLREEALAVRAGTQMGCERILRQRFGVSIAKLREALTILQEEGTIERQHGSGTYVADPLATKHVAIFSNHDLCAPRAGGFARGLAHHLQGWLRERGIANLLYLSAAEPDNATQREMNCPELWRDLERHRVAAVIVLAAPPHAEVVAARFGQLEVPVLGLSPFLAHRCDVPRRQMLRAALGALVDVGCRRLAMLGWTNPVYRASGPFPAMLAAERPWLTARGVELREGWVRVDVHPALPGAGWEQMRDIWHAYPEKPDGLLVADDCLLQDVGLALAHLGVRVPEDLHLAAVTNRDISPNLLIPHTRVEVDPQAIAAALGEMLERLVRHEAVDTTLQDVGFRVFPEAPEHRVQPTAPKSVS